jgi:hypothetical protein
MIEGMGMTDAGLSASILQSNSLDEQRRFIHTLFRLRDFRETQCEVLALRRQNSLGKGGKHKIIHFIRCAAASLALHSQLYAQNCSKSEGSNLDFGRCVENDT